MSTLFSTLWPVQQAILQVLLADSILLGLLAKDVTDTTRPAIFGGDVSENQTAPYIILGDDNNEQSINTFDGTSFLDTFTIHCWSEAHTPAELYSILASLNRLLHRQTLPLIGGLSLLHCFLAPGGVLGPIADPDGISKHLVVPYHIYAG